MNAKVFNLMLGVNETRFLVLHESYESKCRLNENVWITKQKWNHDECQCECKELDDWSSCKKGYLWNPSTCDCECDKAYKICAYLDIENCSCKNRLFEKIVLTCKDEILNSTKTLIVHKKVTNLKSYCFIHNISLVIMCLLALVVISINCYYYYTKHWLKNKHALSY